MQPPASRSSPGWISTVTGPLGQRDSSGTGAAGYRVQATLDREVEPDGTNRPRRPRRRRLTSPTPSASPAPSPTPIVPDPECDPDSDPDLDGGSPDTGADRHPVVGRRPSRCRSVRALPIGTEGPGQPASSLPRPVALGRLLSWRSATDGGLVIRALRPDTSLVARDEARDQPASSPRRTANSRSDRPKPTSAVLGIGRTPFPSPLGSDRRSAESLKAASSARRVGWTPSRTKSASRRHHVRPRARRGDRRSRSWPTSPAGSVSRPSSRRDVPGHRRGRTAGDPIRRARRLPHLPPRHGGHRRHRRAGRRRRCRPAPGAPARVGRAPVPSRSSRALPSPTATSRSTPSSRHRRRCSTRPGGGSWSRTRRPRSSSCCRRARPHPRSGPGSTPRAGSASPMARLDSGPTSSRRGQRSGAGTRRPARLARRGARMAARHGQRAHHERPQARRPLAGRIRVGRADVVVVGQPGAGIASTALIEGRVATVTGIVRRPYPNAADRRFAITPRFADRRDLAGQAAGRERRRRPGAAPARRRGRIAGATAIASPGDRAEDADLGDLIDLRRPHGPCRRPRRRPSTRRVHARRRHRDGTSSFARPRSTVSPLIEPDDALNAIGRVEPGADGPVVIVDDPGGSTWRATRSPTHRPWPSRPPAVRRHILGRRRSSGAVRAGSPVSVAADCR